MTRPISKKANEFLTTDNNDMRSLFAKIRELTNLHARVSPHLPEELREYCQVANLIGGQLILITANGSVATQLRFQNVDLLRKMKQDPELAKIKSIHCKVHPGFSSSTSKKAAAKAKPIPPLTPQTADMVKQIARSLEDPKLKEVMERIARHVKKEG